MGGWGVVRQSRCGAGVLALLFSCASGLPVLNSQLERWAQVVQKEIFDSARCDPGPFIIRKGSAVMGRLSEDSESAVGIPFPWCDRGRWCCCGRGF